MDSDKHYYLHADKFILKAGVFQNGYLEIKDGHFGEYSFSKPDTDNIVELDNKIVSPGLVDTHVHGFYGYDVMDANLKGLKVISQKLLSAGVTSYLPTTLTASSESLNEVCKLIGKYHEEISGAKIRGIFLEGPYFTTKHKGAQNPDYMRDPDIEEFKRWQDSSKNLIRKIGLAPERENTQNFINQVTKQGVHVALGHSDATYEQTLSAIYAGADIFVHTFNGMNSLNHRQPGMIGVAMMLGSYAELICDGHHVHPTIVNNFIKTKGVDYTVLVTDCMQAGGLENGEYMLGEFKVTVEKGVARLKEGGSLAGSILQLKDAIKNVYSWGEVSLFDAISMATSVPARSVGIDDVCGYIQNGRVADFVIFDKELNLKATFLAGKRVYGEVK